jgi:prefoldin subunit 5
MAEDEVARELKNINSTITELQAEVDALKAAMSAGFRRVDSETDAKFELVISEMRGHTGLLKTVLVHVRRPARI